MVSPISYQLDVQNPFQAAMQGYQAGAAIRGVEQQRAQQQAALEQQQREQQILDRVSRPGATADDYAAAMTQIPRHAETLQKAWATKSAAQQQSLTSDLLQWGSAIKSGRPELASERMTERANLMEQTAGAPTPESQALRTAANLLKESPNLVLGQMKAMLAANPAGKEAAAALETFGRAEAAEAKAPAELTKAKAEAVKAEAEAAVAPARERQELVKLGADLGLTQAQTAKTIKETEKLGTEIQKSALELSTGGAIDPEKRFDFESKLRKEYSTQTAGFQETREAYERIKASQDNAVGDLSLIFAYMKMLDPGSVVREGEFANAQNAAGVPERIQNIYNRIASGERLTASQRDTFKGQAKGLLGAAEKREKTVRAGIDNVVKSYRLNPDNVFYEPGAAPAQPQAAPTAAPSAVGAPAVPSKYQGRAWTRY